MAGVQVRTLDGGETTVDEAALETLQAGLRGGLLRPGDAGYEEARTVWNGMIDRRPALIARCTGTADVVAGVRFARAHDLLVSVRGGGHNIAGNAVADGGLMLDLSPMRGVLVDPEARVARVQPGCTLGDVDRETQLHGLAAVLGFVSDTGVAGLTLGGGFGYLTRKHGWTCDTVRAMEVVTPEGEVVTASADERPDLFWALRGGGGNFGVVTRFEYDLFPVGPEVVAGAMAWRGEDAPEVLEFLRELAAEAPEELTVVAGLRRAPPAPWLSEDVHGELIALAVVCHTGPVEEGEALVAPLKAFGEPVGDIITRRPYVEQQRLLDATQPKGRRYYWKSEYLPGLDPKALDALVAQAQGIPSPHSAILLFQLEGALNRLPQDHSPAGNRDAAFVLNIAAGWDDPAEDKAHVAWARRVHEALRPFSTGGTYVNFLTADEGEDRVRAAYGENLDRLAAVKARYDPGNLLRVNKNIPPGA